MSLEGQKRSDCLYTFISNICMSIYNNNKYMKWLSINVKSCILAIIQSSYQYSISNKIATTLEMSASNNTFQTPHTKRGRNLLEVILYSQMFVDIFIVSESDMFCYFWEHAAHKCCRFTSISICDKNLPSCCILKPAT